MTLLPALTLPLLLQLGPRPAGRLHAGELRCHSARGSPSDAPAPGSEAGVAAASGLWFACCLLLMPLLLAGPGRPGGGRAGLPPGRPTVRLRQRPGDTGLGPARLRAPFSSLASCASFFFFSLVPSQLGFLGFFPVKLIIYTCNTIYTHHDLHACICIIKVLYKVLYICVHPSIVYEAVALGTAVVRS
eukprot:SAG31_NODE_883_length_11260_cov_38.912284_5_plen_188_part_00